MKVKICGMRDPQNIREVALLKPDFMGFIFYPASPRYLASAEAFPFDALKVTITTGVFVNATDSDIVNAIRSYKLKAVQLHGNENQEFCKSIRQLGVKVLKAVSVADESDLTNLQRYEGTVDYLVLDTKTKQYGGSGSQFNWDLLNAYTADIPFLLSGGIDEQDSKRIAQLHHPMLAGVDLNSRFELEPGLKNVEKVNRFLDRMRSKNI
ncbi:MAG: phosphoribosylanthranilate isomerase [Paludibacter sp.]|jgi:phosphoribosylanthranilate isomerase|nr:phosphoribosylanthranilate isomerase [Paludibacter sp.]